MSQSTLIYEAAVYTRTVNYKNFKGEEREVKLHFALDPMQLMAIIANFQPAKSKSGNPARRGQVDALTDEQQLKFVRDLCIKAAGEPSNDGEAWDSFPDFDTTLAGKAFLTKLAASDEDRREFAEKVILNPFRSFVAFAKMDPSNTKAEVQQLELMAGQMDNLFKSKGPDDESYEDKKARLAAELASLEETAAGDTHE